MKDMFFEYGRDFFEGYQPQKRNFLNQASRYTVHKKEMLFYEGQANCVCHFLLSGVARVFKTAADGSEIGLNVRFPGTFLNLPDIIEDLSRKDVAVQALTKCEICILDREKCKKLIRSTPELDQRLTQWTCRESRLKDIRKLSRDTEKAGERLLRILAMLCQEALPNAADMDEAQRISLPLTQTHLAQMIGSTQCTVSQYAGQLRDAGILALSRGCVHVLSPSRLLKDNPHLRVE